MRRVKLACFRGVAVLLALLSAAAGGRAAGDLWERVKLVEPGKRVRVELRAGKPVSGTFEQWTPEALQVRDGAGKLVRIEKADVDRLSMVTGMGRGRKAVWAAAATGAILGGLGAAVCVKEGCSSGEAGFVAGAVGFYAAVAAGVAALFPPHREAIYEAGIQLGAYTVQPLGATPVVQRGRTLEVRVQIRDASGRSLASPRLAVRAVEVLAAGGGASLPALNARRTEGDRFRYEPDGYRFRLSTSHLAPGEYALGFRVGEDATLHTRAFQVK